MHDSEKVEKILEDKIPGKCRRVFDLMRCRDFKAGRSRAVALPRYRVIDIQRITGHNSDEQRLRELRTMHKDLFRVHHCPRHPGGGFWHEYQLRRDWLPYLIGEAREQGAQR